MNTNILLINASARDQEAASYQLLKELQQELSAKLGSINVTDRNLNHTSLPLLDGEWVDANFTPEEDRSEAQKQVLALSDSYIEELQKSDVLLIGTPIYNFGVPAALKAYIDLICRARLTFKYTENGPVGLLENKKAYVVITSGGVPLNSAVDFATPYIKQVLNFVGITDITIIDAAQTNEDKINQAKQEIAQLANTV